MTQKTTIIFYLIAMLQADKNNVYNRAKFRQNGGCGYVLKPLLQRQKSLYSALHLRNIRNIKVRGIRDIKVRDTRNIKVRDTRNIKV